MKTSIEDLSPHYEVCPACKCNTLLTKYLRKSQPQNPDQKEIWKDSFCINCRYKKSQKWAD